MCGRFAHDRAETDRELNVSRTSSEYENRTLKADKIKTTERKLEKVHSSSTYFGQLLRHGDTKAYYCQVPLRGSLILNIVYHENWSQSRYILFRTVSSYPVGYNNDRNKTSFHPYS